ncbi:MAG TPA: hypothetical protein V6D17_13015 [Candidatus Obscuribacterales bacterium]
MPQELSQQKLSQKDWLLALPVVGRIALSKAPLWTLALIGLMVAQIIIPETRDYALIALLANLAFSICTATVMCIVANGYRDYLQKQEPKPQTEVLARAPIALVTSYLYWVVVTLGSILLLIPGLILAVRGCLAFAVVCLEHRNPIAGFDESSRLTSGRFWQVVRYLAVPVFLCLFFYFADPIIIQLLDVAMAEENAVAGGSWKQNVAAAALLTFIGCLCMTLVMCITALQVRLYMQFKAGEEKTIKTDEPSPNAK